jgi:hypothetical protein
MNGVYDFCQHRIITQVEVTGPQKGSCCNSLFDGIVTSDAIGTTLCHLCSRFESVTCFREQNITTAEELHKWYLETKKKE